MSFFRLASLIHFLSFSVMCGFTTYVLTYVRTLIDSTFQHLSITPHPNNTNFSAAGLFLGLTQLKFILDLHPPHEHYRVNQLLWLGAFFGPWDGQTAAPPVPVLKSHVTPNPQLTNPTHTRTHTATHLHEADPRTMALGFTSLAFLLLVNYLKRRYPPTPDREARLGYRVWRAVATFATLVVVAAGALAAWLMGRHDRGIPTVGKIEPGLSHAAFPSWSRLDLQPTSMATQALPLALLGTYVRVGRVGLVGVGTKVHFLWCAHFFVLCRRTAFMESYSSGRKFAEENRVELDQVGTNIKPPHTLLDPRSLDDGLFRPALPHGRRPVPHVKQQNQDLFALGVGNLVSACFSTFVAAGSFGRTALAQVRLVVASGLAGT